MKKFKEFNFNCYVQLLRNSYKKNLLFNSHPNLFASNVWEILRLWVASSDYTEDLKIGPEIIKSNGEYYRKIRNTIRFILANLNNWDEKLEKVDIGDLPELERLILHKIYILNQSVQTSRPPIAHCLAGSA